ncbi:MAG: hypothetical protein R3185_00450 [Candidatus Thermoplasmatota archaeon]|nr:hypothetical protein [Candidatus Thermoplasmatota archaeon]
MPMTCAACGVPQPSSRPLVPLAELGPQPEHEAPEVHLCLNCLERREAASWNRHEPEGQAIFEALAGKPIRASSRYTYMIEPDHRIHLLRLRPAWIQRHDTHAHAQGEQDTAHA